MASIEQRLQTLESAANTTDQSMKVFICEGSEPTPDEQERIDAMGDVKVMIVVFGKPDSNRFILEGSDNG